MKQVLLFLLLQPGSTLIAIPTFSQSLPDQNKFYSLVNKATNEALSVQNAPTAWGASGPRVDYPTLISQSQLSTSGAPVTPRRWKFIKVATDGFLYYIQEQNSTHVFDIPHETNQKASKVILHPLVSTAENEQFYLISTGEANTYYISSLTSGLVIDGARVMTERGGVNIIRQEGFTGGDTQKWILNLMQ